MAVMAGGNWQRESIVRAKAVEMHMGRWRHGPPPSRIARYEAPAEHVAEAEGVATHARPP